jgi:hypothetical protein
MFFIPPHDEVHVSCVFTWDKARAEQLAEAWTGKAPVKLGGFAYGDPPGEFTPGLYVRQGITYTSRGCPNQCSYCHVPRVEGKLREIQIQPGNILQDNNFLACRRSHRAKVYSMLKSQPQVNFRGGLETGRLTDWDIDELRGLSIAELWIACDTKEEVPKTIRAIKRLITAGFKPHNIRCYVLIGDDMDENRERLETILEAGALPFAQLFQGEERQEYSIEWKRFAKKWSRPAAYRSKGTEQSFLDLFQVSL